MALNLDKVKDILKPLIEGRDDAADLIEQIMAADTDPDVDVDAIREEALTQARAEMNDRYMAAFFGESSDGGDGEQPVDAGGGKSTSLKEAEGGLSDDEPVTMNDIIAGVEQSYDQEEA